MLRRILEKHVTLSMSNGSVLEGFVSKINENYIELVEIDNKISIVNLNDISFARFGISENQPIDYSRFSESEDSKFPDESRDYSMMTPQIENSNYQKPQLIRSTRKNDIK